MSGRQLPKAQGVELCSEWKLTCNFLTLFITHLSYDEEKDDVVPVMVKFLSHFLHYPTMRQVIDIGAFGVHDGFEIG